MDGTLFEAARIMTPAKIDWKPVDRALTLRFHPVGVIQIFPNDWILVRYERDEQFEARLHRAQELRKPPEGGPL